MEIDSGLQQAEKNQNFFDWLGIFLIMAAAAIARLAINFSTQLMPGLMPAYNLIQARSLLETGHLGFADLPFVFYFEAGFAKMLNFFGLCDLPGCIMTASKITDSLLYPLIAIPIFLLAKTIARDIKTSRWLLFIPPLMLTISISGFMMMADFQKNSIGLMWSMFYIYFLYLATKDGGVKNYLLSGVFFLLTGLTHLGCLGFVIAYSIGFFFFAIIFQREKRVNLLKVLGLLVLVAGLVTLALFFLDPTRLDRLASVIRLPLTMFENPIILGVFFGQIPLQPPHLIIAFVANLSAILGLILFIIKRKEIPTLEKILLLTSATMAAFMASPLLESELGNRLFLMSYVPAAIVIIFLLKYTYTKWLRVTLSVLVFVLMVLPAPIAIYVRSDKCITDEAYQDLLKLKSVIKNPEKTLIITRHGLEYWSAWALEVDVGSGRDITSEDLKKYDVVYYLRQESGQGNFGPFGPGGSSFPEVKIPQDAKIVFQDEFFILAEVPKATKQHPYREQ